MSIQEKQATWNKERPLFEADFIHSHLLPFFNFNENTGDYEIKSEFAEDEDRKVAFETLNTGWAMWLRAKRGAKAEINELKAKLEKTCKWSPDEDLNWWTQCGNGFVFGDDPHPTSHNFKHCCYCGGVIEAVQGEEE